MINIIGNVLGNSGGSEALPKKDNLLLIIGPAQSNSGTTDDGTGQNTGRVAYADMPVYLQTAPANVDYVQQTGSDLAVASWSVSSSLQWGWLNQTLHAISGAWDDIIYCKKSLGGSTILSGGGGDYPRTDLKSRLTVALAEANSRWGAGNYNVAYVIDIGETNSLSAANADDWNAAIQEFVDADLRANYIDGPVLAIKKGVYQVIDFPYIVSNLWAAQDAYVALNSRNYLVSGAVPAGWELQDQGATDDFSHYNAPGAISCGNAVADKILEIHGATRSDATKPILQSAVVEDANPNKIVLTYDKTLNAKVVPFWKAYTLNSTRNIIAIAISGTTVTLTTSENFYIGDVIQLTYAKKLYYENAICDEFGNEADAFTSRVVTNNVNDAAPTYTNVYTSNFSAGEDGWTGLSGGVPAAVDGIGGEDDVLEFGSSDSSPIISHNSLFANTTEKHRVRYKMYVPVNLNSAAPSNDYDLRMSTAIGGVFGNLLYQYFRRNVLGGQWVDLEFTAVPTTAGALRFEITPCTIGDKIYLKNIRVDRLT